MPPKSSKGTNEKKKNSFQWTNEMRLGMAEFVRANYELYKKSLGSQKKMQFLRQMRDHLKISCTDIQLKNGFTHFMLKYNEIDSKLAQSGFGVDPDKDATLDKGWILRQCPYYEILNEVMGTRPNVRPPFSISTSAPSPTTSEVEMIEERSSSPNSGISSPPNVIDNTEDANVTVENVEETASVEQVGSETEASIYVRRAFSGVDMKKGAANVKTPLGVFAKVMGEKTEEVVKIEREKLQFSKEQYDADKLLEREKMNFEMFKFNTQMQLEQNRFQLDLKLVEEKAADREHEIQKLKLQQEFEMKKLQLQLSQTKQ